MLISILIIYPLIRKYKKNFTYLIAPIIIIFIGGYLSQKYGNLRGPWEWTGFAYKGFLRGFFELSLGTIVYEISEKMKNINFNLISKILLTIIEIGGFLSIFVLAQIGKNVKYDFVAVLILAVSISIACSEKTIFYNLANNKLFYYLEELSLPLYLNHIWIINIIHNKFYYLSYMCRLILIILLSLIFSMIILYMIKTIKELRNKKIKKGVINEKI